MAQTGFTPISTYYTTTASAVPTAGNLVNGELALNINTADGKLFYKDSAGVVQVLATKDATSGSFVNLAYTGTLTGGTGVVNLGSGQFYKDASGFVGIGTSSPARSLTVAVSAAYDNVTLLKSAAANAYLTFADSGTSDQTGLSVRIGSAGNAMVFQTGGTTERMRISSTGHVGIGVVPSAWGFPKALQVGGGSLFGYSNINTTLGANMYYNAGTATNKYIADGAASLFQLEVGGAKWFTAPTGTAEGNITFTESLTLNNSGNLALQGATTSANGVGVTFPTTQSASSNANCLDDYEEGTWTPVIADASSGGNTGTFTNNGSYYTKIGNQVTITTYLNAINTTGMTGGNTFFVRGLPFTSGAVAEGNFYTYRVGRNASTVSSSVVLGSGRTHINFGLYTTNSATTDLSILVSNIVSGTSEIMLTLTYFV